ncbi:MAG: ASKHA domain-containing protein [Thermodesulfobacteriota bacterium]
MITAPKDKKQKVSIIFQPSGRRGEGLKGQTILQAAQELGVEISSICGGKQSCGKCLVKVEWGIVNPSALTEEERKFITPEEEAAGYRLACAAKIESDSLITVPGESSAAQPLILKNLINFSSKINPAVKNYYLELTTPTLQDPRGDLERLQERLKNHYGLKNLSIDYSALPNLSLNLRQGNWKVTALVSSNGEILSILPGKIENYYGLALDIGTTSLAIYLGNLKNGQIIAANSRLNPQVIFGEDVMSRIQYALEKGAEGLKSLTMKVRGAVNELIQETAKGVAISLTEIIDMVVVGNTAMHHLFLGLNPQYLGVAPFTPALHNSLYIKARELGLNINPGAYVYFLPIEAGFVGADNVGVLIFQEPYLQEEISLIIDVGTNGEILLGNKKRILSASCATGPAFEGAHIKFGMRAAPGAIERIRIDSQNGTVKYRVIGSEKWVGAGSSPEIKARGICGSGIIEAVAEMRQAGIIERNGRIRKDLPSFRQRFNAQGEFIIAHAEETAFNRDITISIEDIRAIQLAKAALYAGAKILMKEFGIEKPDKVILAGGFGSIIDPERAMAIGLFPPCDLQQVRAVGNAAGMGACLALFDQEKRAEAECAAKQVEYIELTTHPDFQEEFIKALSFPT